LEKAAEVGYAVFAEGGSLLGSILLPVLRFLLAPRSVRSDPPQAAAETGRIEYIPPTTWYGKLIEDVIMWGSKGIMVLLLSFAAGTIIFFVARWLFRRSGRVAGQKESSDGVRNLLLRLWLALVLFIHDIQRRLRGYKTAADLYRALKPWGRRSGLPHRLTETPSEFGNRLGRSHPALSVPVRVIVDSFNRTTYGKSPFTDRDLSQGRSSLRALSHPRHWPKRLKTILLRHKDPARTPPAIRPDGRD
jgi:hypothetical protein